jgi:energy-converting hydrogenase Eha subunit F
MMPVTQEQIIGYTATNKEVDELCTYLAHRLPDTKVFHSPTPVTKLAGRVFTCMVKYLKTQDGYDQGQRYDEIPGSIKDELLLYARGKDVVCISSLEMRLTTDPRTFIMHTQWVVRIAIGNLS